MTMFIVAGEPLRDGPNSHCEGGKKRTEDGLAKYGLKMGDTVTMRDALEVIGLSDTVFSLAFVVKQSQSEARTVLLKYMQYQLDIVKSLLPVLSITKYEEHMRAVNKRVLGHMRPEPLEKAHAVFLQMYRDEIDVTTGYALHALVVLSNGTIPDNIAATHAGISLMDAGRGAGRGEQVREQLEAKMRDLIPTSPQDKWDKLKETK